MRFKIDRASLIVRSKFTIFALFYFVFEVNFPSTSPGGGGGGGLYLDGQFNEGFFALPLACLLVYEMTGRHGARDDNFLKTCFQKLLINFTW